MPRILLTGKTGRVGWDLQRALATLGNRTAPGRGEMNLADPDSIRAAIRGAQPGIIINAAGYTTVDKAESEPDLVMRVNAVAPGILAEEAKRAGALLIHYSTDYVYDGKRERPYTEDDAPNPVNTYGKSKLAGERAIQAVGGTHLILRTSWIYCARSSNFVLSMLRLAREKPVLPVVNDQAGSPSWARALADSTAELLLRRHLIPGNGGIYHLSASGHTSRYEFARAIIRIMQDLSGTADGWAEIRPITSGEYPLPARRPRNPVTDKGKIQREFGIEMPHWESQLRDFLSELTVAQRH
jgi:dTDP-4-dehydrorhamnose reductase